MIPSLVVSEVFGPTIQGEGPSLGRRCAFVRLGGCNLSCVWCDTPYTWDARRYDLRAELHRMSVEHIADLIMPMEVPLVVISGGEPLLHQGHGLEDLLLALPRNMTVEIETNGTVHPTPGVAGRCYFNVSPKLAHSGDPLAARIKPPVLAEFGALSSHSERAIFKVVCRDVADLDELDALGLPRSHTFVMPEGVTRDDVDEHLAALADEAVARGYNLTTRLHITVWKGVRGR